MVISRKTGRAPLLISTAALVIAVVGAGGPAVARALNADKVDGRHAVGPGATPAQRAGKLVATNAQGRLPATLIPKALDADKLDGVDGSALLTKAAAGTGGTVNAGGNPLSWNRLKDVPASLADGDAGEALFGGVQFTTSVGGSTSVVISTHSWPVTQPLLWYAVPTAANGARLTTSVAIQNENGLITYIITVTNVTGTATSFDLRYVAVPPS